MNKPVGGPHAVAVVLCLICCLLGFAFAKSPILLNYHQIGANSVITHSPSSETLDAHIAHVLQHGFGLTTASGFHAAVQANQRVALLTFDDGFKSVITQALPVLNRHEVAGTAFIVASRIDQPGYLSGADLRELQAAGWEIGNHTLHHAALTDLTPAGIRHQIQRANELIEAASGVKPACVAYPFGLHDATVRQIVSKTNACAYTTGPAAAHGGTDPLALPRSPLSVFDDRRLADGTRSTPLITAAVSLGVFTWLLPDASHIGAPPAVWTPTAFRELGDGRYRAQFGVRGSLQQLSVREQAWSVNLLHGRGSQRAHAFGLARMTGPVTLAGAFVAGEGFGAGISLDLAGYGETWVYWTQEGGSRVGIQVIPLDYVRVTATYQHLIRHATVDVSLPLPLLAAEGFPVRVGLGVDRKPYASLSVRAGAHTVSVKTDTTGTAELLVDLRW